MGLGIRKNDLVVVLAGRSRGKKGKVLGINAAKNRAMIEGVNLIKRYVRKTRKNPQGGLVDQEASVAISSLALFCSHCNRGRRFRTGVLKDGSKTRTCVECENVIGA